MKTCIIIPVYNAENHIVDVIADVLRHADSLIVVNDGSTDGTLEKLKKAEKIELVSYPTNRGKGYALRQGFRRALELDFTHAVTLDADGQHLAGDIPDLVQKATENPDALIVGSRSFDDPNMPKGNRFANRFSNFWFAVQTLRRLPDTQTGYRVYPLQKMGQIRLFTNRYEAELELLVRCAWRGMKLIPQPVNVFYPPIHERLSHFRGGRDFFRISVLNTVLCFFAVVYGYPGLLFRKIVRR
jgi:glycosyltransferase involved in cell wall biosynthesis